jgi:hypothetical protein
MRISPFLSILCVILIECKSPVTPANAQPLIGVRELPRELNECSGMVMLDDKTFVALNDGGDNPNLYLFSEDKSKKIRIIKVDVLRNNDWEEITRDEKSIFIGDFGNNSGVRRSLVIYKIKIEDLLTSDKVPAEAIQFSYKEQTNFNRSNDHNYDCEAMVSAGDSLYLFTKNRANHKTDVYSLPKTPGVYSTKHLGEINSDGMISGAVYRPSPTDNKLVLTGYSVKRNSYYPFLLVFDHVESADFFKAPMRRIVLDKQLQLESVLFYDDNDVLLASEEGKWSNGWIYKVKLVP